MITVEISLTRTSCCVCGCPFAIPSAMHEKKANDGGEFFCPNGHSLAFTENRSVKLRRELDAMTRRYQEVQLELKAERSRYINTIARINANAERKRRRVNAGVCPHCHRTFQGLARHIRSKHPTEPLPNQ